MIEYNHKENELCFTGVPNIMADEKNCIKSEPMDLEELNLPSNEDHNLTINEEFSETPVKPKEVSETSTKSKKAFTLYSDNKVQTIGVCF